MGLLIVGSSAYAGVTSLLWFAGIRGNLRLNAAAWILLAVAALNITRVEFRLQAHGSHAYHPPVPNRGLMGVKRRLVWSVLSTVWLPVSAGCFTVTCHTQGWNLPNVEGWEGSISRAPDPGDGAISEQPAHVDTSRYRYRLRVTDRIYGTVVHDQNWKGDEAGARQAFDRIERDLDGLNVAGFCKEYGIALGSEA